MFGHQQLPALVLLLAVAGCAPPAEAPQAQVDTSALRAAIEAREREWSAAFLAGDAAGVASLYTEDGAQVQPSGEWARGRDGITQAMRIQLDSINVTAREDITEELIVAGDYLVEIGRYSYRGTSKFDNKPRSGAGRYMVLWRQDADGVWRLHRDIGNDAPPVKP